jgi:hypothetical protein
VRAQARMPTSSAEGEVGVRMAGNVEAVSVVEDQLVPVRGVEEEHDLVAGFYLGSRQRDVCGGRAAEVDDRRRPPEDLLHRARRESREVATPAGARIP